MTLKKPRIFHSQRDCPIRRRHGLPIEKDEGAHLSFHDTKVGEVVARECRFCQAIRESQTRNE